LTLEEVLHAAAEAIRPVLEAARQTLVLPVPAPSFRLHADALRLSHVFINLLDNASKYSAPGSRIETQAHRERDRIAVAVADQGRGIPPEDPGRIFDVFFQADLPDGRTHKGLGLGLTLVKRLVEQHGGSVEATSEGAERGSRFVVRLPLVETAG